MFNPNRDCPDCRGDAGGFDRRSFLKAAGAAAVAAGSLPVWAEAKDSSAAAPTPETLVKVLYEKLSDEQKQQVCFDWNHRDPKRGLLRTRISANWHITEPAINSEFYTAEQQSIIRQIFEQIISPDWHERVDKQLQDDTRGFGNGQNIAIFGQPGTSQFEFVLTGRHQTIRCDGNSADHVAFGGPIFYGHAASGFHEAADHPGNVYWHQAVEANKVYQSLDGKQQQVALVQKQPKESAVGFRSPGEFAGIAVSELSSDQKEHLQKVLQLLIEPYRQSDRDEVVASLQAQGGLDKCSLAFYKEGDIGGDEVYDCWRLEGPAFVWYFRGEPHVHVWVNVANHPSVKLNS